MVNIRKPKNALRLSRPASWWGSTWRDALPTGNGTIGAAIYGGAGSDTIMLTHADLWWQGHVGVLSDVADKLPQVRKSLDNQNFREAEDILQNSLIAKGYRPRAAYPLPICDLKVSMPIERGVRDYARTLNMENGEVSVTFRDNTTRVDRSLFVSRTSDIICYEISKTGSRTLEVTFAFDLHDRFNLRTPTTFTTPPEGINIKYENHFMYFSARSDNGTDYGAVAKITFYGGSQTVTPNGITIKDADKIFVVIKPFVESSRDKEWKGLRTELTAIKLTYDKLIKEHTQKHAKIIGTVDLDLDADQRDTFADQLLDRTITSGDLPAALLEKLFCYGRFLSTASSTTDAKPIAPYGIWCGDFKGHDSHLSATQILAQYSHILASNPEYFGSVVNYYSAVGVLDDLKKNAARLYECGGIFIPDIMAHGTGLLGSVDSSVIHNVAISGMIACMFFDYYQHTTDVAFLKNKALPFMRDTVAFYEHFLKVQPDNLYQSAPSYSAPTTPANFSLNGETLNIARNSTVDFAVVRALLTRIIRAAEITGQFKDEVLKWKDMLTRIPSYQFNDDNTVREYCDARLADNPKSPSTALFYGVYPSTDITPDTPELSKAFLQTAKKRFASSIKNQNITSLLTYALIFARLGDGNTAYEILTSAVRSMSMDNLIFATNDWRGNGIGVDNPWATFTTVGNSLASALVTELLLQATFDSVRILPALPDALPKGEISGLLCRAGVEVSIAWDKKRGTVDCKLKARKATKITVIIPDFVKKVKVGGTSGEKVDYQSHTITDLDLPSGKNITLEMR